MSRLWSRGQRSAFDKLYTTARTFFEVSWQKNVLRPRFDRLVVGPSGVGKSHLVRELGAVLDVPILRLGLAEWIVVAARQPITTMGRVQELLTSHDRAIIHIDEVDKVRADLKSDWSAYQQGELFQLLDRNPAAPTHRGSWSSLQLKRLRDSTLIIASGTWQSLWDTPDRASIGFQAGTPGDSRLTERIRRTPVIPEELRRRFAGDLIIIPRPLEQDFREAALDFGLEHLATALGERLDYGEAETSQYGARWLEETYARLLARALEGDRHDLLPSPPCGIEDEII